MLFSRYGLVPSSSVGFALTKVSSKQAQERKKVLIFVCIYNMCICGLVFSGYQTSPHDQRLVGYVKKDTTSIFWVMSYGLCPRCQLRKVHDGMPDCIDITCREAEEGV